MRPVCTSDEAGRLAHDLFGVEGKVKRLDSYSDQNFLIGGAYVLKIANSSEPEPVLRFQQAALQHVQHRASELHTPQVRPLVDGRLLGEWQGTHLVWMVDYIPGHFISDLDHHPPALLNDLGMYLGRLDRALASFEHDAMQRDLQWDLKQASRLNAFLSFIDDAERKDLVQQFLNRFEERIMPRFSALRSSVIHNDANDNNVLVYKTGDQVKGLIDFGDMVHTFTVCEPAIAIAYMMLGKEDLLDVACIIARGYNSVYPLEPAEIEVLFDLVCIRLCTSVCMSARERKKAPDNEYLAISEAPAWKALYQLVEIDPHAASSMMKDRMR